MIYFISSNILIHELELKIIFKILFLVLKMLIHIPWPYDPFHRALDLFFQEL